MGIGESDTEPGKTEIQNTWELERMLIFYAKEHCNVNGKHYNFADYQLIINKYIPFIEKSQLVEILTNVKEELSEQASDYQCRNCLKLEDAIEKNYLKK